MYDVHPEQYDELLNKKSEKLTVLFNEHTIPDIDVISSPAAHFRMRAEFRIWREDDAIHYAMFSKEDKKTPIYMTRFPRASKTICDIMQPLLSEISRYDSLKKRLFEIDFLSNQAGDILVTLIYHKQLNEQWREDALQLQSLFPIKIIGRARKQREVLSDDFILEKFTVNNKHITYQQVENSFTQPNAAICEKMLNWAVNHSPSSSGDLLELYCGNGNFTLALAQNFRKVLATEVSKTSVKSARYNIELNKIDNIDIVRMSSEEITQAFNKTRDFRRLKDINLDDYQFDTLFVDPPRSGIDAETLAFANRFDNIIYISCNPDTLIANLKQLPDYHIKRIALFDQFPYTDHIECGVILSKITTRL